MPDEIIFKDHSIEVKGAMKDAILNFLEEATSLVEADTANLTKVKSGDTRRSWEHKVIDDELAGYVGSNFENAIWEEYGTGEYALEGNGRKGGWYYVDSDGVGHFTHGKKPRRMLHTAFEKDQNAIKRQCETVLKNKVGKK